MRALHGAPFAPPGVPAPEAVALLATRGLVVAVPDRTLVRELDWAIAPGEAWCVLGRNGAGKTSLLRTLAGLRAPSAGTVELDGRPLARVPPETLARARGYLPQRVHDAFGSSVIDTVLVGRFPHRGRWAWESAADVDLARAALGRVGLAALEARDVRTLSGGERQRVALASVLAQDPRLVLLDEPVAALDLSSQLAVAALLASLAREERRAVVVAMHDVNLATRFASHALLLLGEGGFVAGPVAEVVTAANLSRAYGTPVRAVPDGPRALFVAW